MLHDDDGENISALNPMYCELTAQYWAWKNLDADYYGFCHYRRYFNFSKTKYKEDEYGNILEQYPGEYIVEKYGQDESSVRKAVDGNDIIITERKDIRRMPGGRGNIIDQYGRAEYLHRGDIHLIHAIINELTPEYSKAADAYLHGHTTSFCNMYILKKDIFFEYCEWLFLVLAEFCKRTDMKLYSTEALRTPGHLSERLFGIFLRKKQMDNPRLKIKELQCVYFKKTDVQDNLDPVYSKNAIPIVFAANNNFVPVFATCLQSVIDTSSQNRNYDIVLIQSDVSTENKKILQEMLQNHSNFSLRFYDASRLLSDYKLEAKEHISVETYYRFLIQSAMPKYEKVLYIDCDLIVKKDLAELYDIDIDGYMLAAALDPDFIGQVNGANPTTREYAEQELHLSNPYAYFQAGVLLFNEKEMRKAHPLNQWLKFATKPYRYSDQDVLNVHCQGRVKYLDMKWNMIFNCNHERVPKVIAYAPAEIQEKYNAAHADPAIIHYAGFMKPWHNPNEEFAEDFWSVARKTPFYEKLIYSMNGEKTEHEINVLAKNLSFRGRNKDRARRLYGKLIKKNSTFDRALRKKLNKNSD